MIHYTLTRSQRKTMAISIRDGIVEVRAPLHVPKAEIDRVVATKEQWILEKLAHFANIERQRESFRLTYGDTIRYRGKAYPVCARPGDRIGFDEEKFYLPPDLGSEEIKHACVQIYRLLARRDLPGKVHAFSQMMQLAPSAVKINSAKTRWGSCSAQKSLNFSWRLILADDEVIDYVVVHELAHILQMNHSKQFWAIIEGVLPDYRTRKDRLKALSHQIQAEGW